MSKKNRPTYDLWYSNMSLKNNRIFNIYIYSIMSYTRIKYAASVSKWGVYERNTLNIGQLLRSFEIAASVNVVIFYTVISYDRTTCATDPEVRSFHFFLFQKDFTKM